MQTNEQERQLSLEELLIASPCWGKLPGQIRAEVVELIAQMLREHVAPDARGISDE
jgi:hypothetical protein